VKTLATVRRSTPSPACASPDRFLADNGARQPRGAQLAQPSLGTRPGDAHGFRREHVGAETTGESDAECQHLQLLGPEARRGAVVSQRGGAHPGDLQLAGQAARHAFGRQIIQRVGVGPASIVGARVSHGDAPCREPTDDEVSRVRGAHLVDGDAVDVDVDGRLRIGGMQAQASHVDVLHA